MEVKDGLSICFAMVDEDPSLHGAATGMWNALVPFMPALTQAQMEFALNALDALAGPDASTQLRMLRRRSGRCELAFVIDQWLAHREA